MLIPWLSQDGLNRFSQIQISEVNTIVDKLLAENDVGLRALLENRDSYCWDNLVMPLEEMNEKFKQFWAAIGHLHSVLDSPALRDVYNQSIPKITQHYSELGHNQELYEALQSLTENDSSHTLTAIQKKLLEHELRDFRLSGVNLPPDKKQHYIELQQQLEKSTTLFEEHVLDATDGWFQHITDVSLLAGVPPHALAKAKEAAQKKNLEGWVITLEYPCYEAVIQYADHRSLREEIYTAYVTRASDQGPQAGRWDNSTVMDNILSLRHQIAQLLGFENYAEYSLAVKMANSTKQVFDFLYDLAKRVRVQAQQEFDQLKAFACTQGVDDLQSWDIPYYTEKLQKQRYAISQEELRPYFPEGKVLVGMFEVVKRLYGITITEKSGVDTWHPDVRFFEIYDENKQLRGQFYLDLYARANKRGGAWMDDARSRRRNLKGKIETPVAFLTCNFSGSIDGIPSLLTHDEVITLFHEFGHGLHHLLTKMDYAGVSGMNGVPMDAVEFPSQFLEQWCWHKEVLDLIAVHYLSGEPLPDTLFQKMIAAKNFQSGMQLLRQLEFSLFDFKIHYEYDPKQGGRVQEILDDVRKQISVFIPPSFNRFQHSFSHIFAGGYAAGYYSYKWSEVLSSDAFSKFEEEGIFNQKTGRRFLKTILEQGGSRDPIDLFIAFLGRGPQIDALLRHSGIPLSA